MSITVSDIQTELNTRIGDSSTDRVSAAQRLSYITQGVVWLQEKLMNDHQAKTYDINFYDGVNYYKLTTVLDDLLEANDLNTKVLTDGGQPFTRKSSQELRAEIGYNFSESSYSIERRDSNSYLLINHDSKYPAMIASSCESTTADGGTWAVDSTNSDATNLTIDTDDFTQGSGSFSFDVDVSQSGNNKATIYNDDLTSEDLSDYKDIAAWLVDVKIPDTTYISSYTFKWGSSTSNYYSVTATTDVNANAFADDDFITLKFDWLGATVTGTPDDTAINYIDITVNYTGSQADATSFKIDNIRIVRPQKLKFYYTSWIVGTDTNGTDILKFGATTDIPYFSGQYDQYKFPVADYAASRAFKDLRLYKEADASELDAEKSLLRLGKIIPKSFTREMKSFKVAGINFRRGRYSNRRIVL